MSVINSISNDVRKIIENDSAHDFEHIMRVYKNAQNLCKKEKVNEKLVLCAVLLHDIVSYPKSNKRSKNSSIDSAKKAKIILKRYGFTENEITIISDAIRDHSFSQKKTPKTIEGKILQDADRLDALGAIGIARVFATGGSLKRPFYNIDDPFCKKRNANDKTWTLDHFFSKIIKTRIFNEYKIWKNRSKKEN